jgi:sensor histidine kinase YesM
VIVPTFTFQPLLENAIIHGISPKIEGGKVSVYIREKEGKLLIDVSDTGAGMNEETLLEIKRHLSSGEDSSDEKEALGIGLGNINKRIRAMYDGGSLDIDSKKNEGTTVTISIPLQGVDN